ncbi:hypothetical protein [Agreia bicolorata]|uniref:hypothetical protein n=1 Tax=Agreia bicolorata TaxID=110935 RepID=UPI000ADA563B|nr:hypothetical protein [Agreia bicolorata]
MNFTSPDNSTLTIDTIALTIEVSLYLDNKPHFASLTGETFYLEDGSVDEVMTHGRYID